MKYRNFDLEAFDHQITGGMESFRVRVSGSPAGEMRIANAERVQMPSDFRRRLRSLERRGLNQLELIELGETIADLLFPPRTRDLLDDSQVAIGDVEGLRIRLRLDTYTLADIPWEYAYINPSDTPASQKGSEGFLALDRRLSLVRYEIMEQPPGRLEAIESGMLRLVSLMANPVSQEFPELQLSVEEGHIRQALQEVAGLQLDFFPDGTLDSLEEALSEDAHIFHFAGHGQFQGDLGAAFGSLEGAGAILLVGDGGAPFPLPAERLARNLAGRRVRLAVLGACEAGRRDQVNAWSGVVPAITQSGVPAVVGMQYTIQDRHAIAFSRRLFRAMAAGHPIDAAVADGRLAIFNRSNEDERDWGVPVLYLRLPAEDSGVVLFPRPQVVEPGNTWEDIRGRAREQADRFLNEARGRPERPGTFITELYVRRAALETALAAFLESQAQAMILLGDSGVGKTNLLCQWALDLQEAGHAVFLYNCAGSLRLEVNNELAQDLSLSDGDQLILALDRIADQAVAANAQFIILFDALNQFRGPSHTGPQDLLERLDSLAGRLPQHGVRMVVSCSTATWKQLENQGALNLFWTRYHQHAGERVLRLEPFTPTELREAYDRYQDHFRLQTSFAELPAALERRLRTPLLLRMLAEAYRDRPSPILHDGLALSIFRRYYEERVRRRQDQIFADQLAAEMYNQRRGALQVDDLALHDTLRREVLSEDPDSSYNRLLDSGLLTETSGDLLVGDEVRFTYSRVGAFALARHLERLSTGNGVYIPELARQGVGFPMAWEAARTLLLMRRDSSLFTDLAQSQDVEVRELVVESLVELHADEPGSATRIIRSLLETDSEESRRTGLKAAYYIGPGVRDVFIWAAGRGNTELRRITKDVLYLVWRHDPEFTYGLLTEVGESLSLRAPLHLRNKLEFLIDLSITIYINHPEQEEVIQQTTDLWYEVLTNRLHLDLFNTGFLGERFERMIFRAVGIAFTGQLMDTVLFTDFVPADRFFDLPEEERARFQRVIGLVDPQTEIENYTQDLKSLLEAEIILFNILGALVLAIHSYHDFDHTEPLLRDLWERLNAYGRQWALMSFSVLLPGTPPAWTPLLEDFTRQLAEEQREAFFGRGLSFQEQFDILLLPLGLGYGKRGSGMPLFTAMIRSAIQDGDLELARRCLAGLAPAGFYYPQTVFESLRESLQDMAHPELQDVLVKTLATMRTLHFDAVDVFMDQMGADEAFQRRVAAAADVSLVRRYIYALGIYNNAVHQALFYPKMRRNLLIGGLEALVAASSPSDFISNYTLVPIRMLRAANYRLSEWTLPE